MNAWIINLAGLGLMVFIVAWFWLWKSRATPATAGQSIIDIVVTDGVYEPATISIPKGQPVTLRFHRRDASACAEQVVFHGLGISEALPLNMPHDVTLTVAEPGTYRFTCQMQMYQGTLVVLPANTEG